MGDILVTLLKQEALGIMSDEEELRQENGVKDGAPYADTPSPARQQSKSLSPVAEKKSISIGPPILSVSPRPRSLSRSPQPRSLSKSPRPRSYSRSPAAYDKRSRSRSRPRKRSPSRERRRSPSPYRRRYRSPSPRRYRSRSRDRYYEPRSRYGDRDRYSDRDRFQGRRRSPPYRRRSPPRRRRTPPSRGLHLFVAGLNFVTTDREVEDKFDRSGDVVEARIVRNPSNGESRGFGFVEMKTEEGADRAIRDYDGQEWKGRTLLVERARNIR